MEREVPEVGTFGDTLKGVACLVGKELVLWMVEPRWPLSEAGEVRGWPLLLQGSGFQGPPSVVATRKGLRQLLDWFE